MERDAKQPALSAREHPRSNVEENRRRLARRQNLDDSGLLEDEQAAGSVARMSHEHRAGQVGRQWWAEPDLRGRRGVNSNNYRGDDVRTREKMRTKPSFPAGVRSPTQGADQMFRPPGLNHVIDRQRA